MYTKINQPKLKHKIGKKIPKEEYLEDKRKKKWYDKDGSCCFTLYARSLYIVWGQSSQYWSWNSYKDTDDDNIEVAKLETVCWLEMKGSLAMSELTEGVTYESVCVVKLTKQAFGWEHPITLRLKVPGEPTKTRQLSLLMQPKGEWFELQLGTFQAKHDDNRDITFEFDCITGHWKGGLVVKSIVIRPKH